MNEKIEGAPVLIMQRGKIFSPKLILAPFAFIAIYSVIIHVIILDIWLITYQFIYFNAAGIPKVLKKDYMMFDRWDLSKLNIWQKINCVYCEYVNGTFAWAKGVANQTEIYSCAIRHSHARKGQEHESGYYEYEKFK